MRIIDTAAIAEAVTQCISHSSINISTDAKLALEQAYALETKPLAQFALEMLNKNIGIAADTCTPICQDTGMCVVFVNIGWDVKLEGAYIDDVINAAVAAAYIPLRKSVATALRRDNTKTNTPAVIHYNFIKGENVEVSVLLKGFGSENMSKLYMLTPSKGVEGVKQCIVDTVKTAGGNPCPPVILGVGIGGTMEKACIMSKQALLRDINAPNPVDYLDNLELECLESINALGIGAEGFGGDITCLGVNILEFPTHIASIPVAVTVQCHCSRHSSVII